MKNILSILFLATIVCCWSCSGGEEDVPTPTPTPKPETNKIEISTSAPVVEQKGGTASVSFTTNAAWTASIGTSTSWLKVSPTSGTAGTHTLTITTEENDTYDERNATLTIKAGNASQNLTITQKQKDGLTITSNKVEVGSEGGNFSIEAKANVSVTFEIEESAKDWITAIESRGLTAKTLNFTAKANDKTERRQGNIILKGGDGLSETVTIYQDGNGPTLVITSDDIIVGSDGENIKIELKSNVDYTMTVPQVDWISKEESRAISAYTHYLTIAPNETYDQRSAVVYFQSEAEGLKDSINITQLQKDAIIVAKNEYEVAPEGKKLEFTISTNVDFEVSVSVDWIKQNTSSRALVEKVLSFTIDKNEGKESREGEIYITFENLKQTIKVIQNNFETAERTALIEFYNATNGDKWANNENWCSDKPLNEWYGISTDKNGRVNRIFLTSNYLDGTIPESFALFLDNCTDNSGIGLDYNHLYGTIPKAIRNHPRWPIFGWSILPQSKPEGITGAFDTEHLNLPLTNQELFSLDGKSSFNSLNFVQSHKMTLIISMEMDLSMNYYNFDRLVNLCLGYQNKGLNVLIHLYEDFSGDFERFEWEQRIKELPTTNLIFTKEKGDGYFSPSFFAHKGHVGLFDEKGYTLGYLNSQNFRFQEESIGVSLAKATERLVAKHLGEPEEHPDYSSEMYTSTDFSKDGEVTILQEASIGKGLDLVFMGDAFVDKDMEEGGAYEQAMRQGVEEMFAIEPYKSLRERFNIYMVKAVSPNASFAEDAKRAINSDADCFEYAQKVSGINMDNVGIIMITNPNTLSGLSYCINYADNSYIVFVMSGRLRRGTIAHEVGHGLGRLLDEYVEDGYEKVQMPEEAKIKLDKSWEDYGWGANVDWRNDSQTVRWAHFLKDVRYVNEGLGIFEGANGDYGLGCYRPTENSIMNDDYNHPYFNAPCREQLYKVIMQRSEGEDWKYDYEEFVKFDEKSRNTASRSAIKPFTESEKREYVKNHRPPTIIKGTWRDAMKGKNQIVVPLR